MCGLAGIISKDKKPLNTRDFNTLGILNDERGGDSCGIFIDGQCKYGINETAYYRDFMSTIELPEEASITILHCRKTSPKYTTNIQQAQPIVIREDGVIKFVLMHNGFISNIDNLAKKYIPKLNITGFSDSQVMAAIIYNCGYNVLNEYEGAAVFMIVDYREKNPTVRLFKGSSIYNPSHCDSERPLFIMKYNDRFYFSSTPYPLILINKDYSPLTIKANHLIQVKEDYTLYCELEAERSKLTKVITTTTTYTSNVSKRVEYDPNSGLYKTGDSLAHLNSPIWPSGYKADAQYCKDPTIAFFKGRLLLNNKCFQFIEDMIKKYHISIDDDLFTSFFPLVDFFSYNPIMKDGEYYRVDDEFKYISIQDDSWVSLFTNTNKYILRQGKLDKIPMITTSTYNKFQQDQQAIFFNFTEIEDSIRQYLIK